MHHSRQLSVGGRQRPNCLDTSICSPGLARLPYLEDVSELVVNVGRGSVARLLRVISVDGPQCPDCQAFARANDVASRLKSYPASSDPLR